MGIRSAERHGQCRRRQRGKTDADQTARLAPKRNPRVAAACSLCLGEAMIVQCDLQSAEPGEGDQQAKHKPGQGFAPAWRREQKDKAGDQKNSRHQDPCLAVVRPAVRKPPDDRILQAVDTARGQQHHAEHRKGDAQFFGVVARRVDVERQTAKGEHGSDRTWRIQVAPRESVGMHVSHCSAPRAAGRALPDTGSMDQTRCRETGPHHE